MNADELRYVPLFPRTCTAPIELCVAVRSEQDPAAGWLIPLFETSDAMVYLGALCDASGRRNDWLEIWVQTIAANCGRARSEIAEWNNAFLDARWRERCATLAALTPDAVFRGPWETDHPQPVYLRQPSGGTWVSFHPVLSGAPNGVGWRLCLDDALLRRTGLPTYTGSSDRFLYDASLGSDPLFIPLGSTAVTHRQLAPANPSTGFPADAVPLNPEGGLLFIRRHALFSLSQFKRLIEGYDWTGHGRGREGLLLDAGFSAFQEQGYAGNNHGLIFGGRRGRTARILEGYLLKLMLFREAVCAVTTTIRREDLPFIDLTAVDFRVALDLSWNRLPRLWQFRLQLSRTSEAAAVDIQGGGLRYFRPIRPLDPSVYRPRQLGRLRGGRGSLRLRDIREEQGATMVCEGTLADSELSGSKPSDLLRLDLPVRSQCHTVFARILAGQNLAAAEVRFESLPFPPPKSGPASLLALKGVPLEEVSFVLMPQMSSPCDLYTLAVIGLELLIDTRKADLAVVLDECLSLAREIQRQPETQSLVERRSRVVEGDSRFEKSLGPQNLCRENLTREQGYECIPRELWWGLFDILVRMLPGELKDGWARDLGDVNPQALDSCLLPALEELDALIERVRSFLFLDWSANREALTVLAEFE